MNDTAVQRYSAATLLGALDASAKATVDSKLRSLQEFFSEYDTQRIHTSRACFEEVGDRTTVCGDRLAGRWTHCRGSGKRVDVNY